MAEQTIERQPQASATGLSFEDFLREYDSMHAEWLDGEVILMSPPSLHHQDMVGFLYILLRQYLSYRSLGRVIFAPVAMRILNQRHGREPDLVVVKTEHSDRLKRNYIEGPADVVIEIVSPESSDRDRGEKFREYEAAGVPEYWLLDPIHEETAFYHLTMVKNDDDVDELRYRRIEPDANGDFHSVEIAGFRLRVETLWQDTFPTVEQTLEIVRAMLS